MTPKTILIVEDNREISDMLSTFLSENGYETECAYNGLEAAACLKKREYTLILMDLMLPYRSGNDLIKELRTRSNVPVICLSARSGMETRLEVLRMGADDYILKPFDLNEVLVRIEVVLRRSCGNTGQLDSQDGEKKLMFKNLVLDMEGKCAVTKGTHLSLTAKELAILQLFLEYPNKTFSKANLYEAIWQEPYYYEDNTLNVHMSNLRNKLKKMDDGVEYIETVWGIGYRLAAVNLTTLLLNVILEHEILIRENGLQPNIDLPEKTLLVHGNPQLLERIFDNLLGNIFKYAREELKKSNWLLQSD